MLKAIDLLIVELFQKIVVFFDYVCGVSRKMLLKILYSFVILAVAVSYFQMVFYFTQIFLDGELFVGGSSRALIFSVLHGILISPFLLTAELYSEYAYEEKGDEVIRTRLIHRVSFVLFLGALYLFLHPDDSNQWIKEIVEEFFARPVVLIAELCGVVCYVIEYVACTKTPPPKSAQSMYSVTS